MLTNGYSILICAGDVGGARSLAPLARVEYGAESYGHRSRRGWRVLRDIRRGTERKTERLLVGGVARPVE